MRKYPVQVNVYLTEEQKSQLLAIVPTLNKYVAFHGLGLEKMVVNTVINPNQSKYQEYDLEKNRLIQELKTRQPYYGDNLNTEILSGNRVNKSLAGKTQFSSVKKSGNKN